MKIAYIEKNFRDSTLETIRLANAIVEQYQAQGLSLTLRQLYYQLVARDLIPNRQKEYKRLGSIIADARLAGLISWTAIEDRTRNLAGNSHWSSPASIVQSAVRGYAIDKWADQPHRVECFLADTPVYTNDGVIPIAAVRVGDMVLADDGSYRQVTEVFSRPYRGEILVINAVGQMPIRVTPNHPFLVRAYDDKRPGYKGARRKYHPTDWTTARQLKKFDYLLAPRMQADIDVSQIELRPGARSYNPGPLPLDDDLLRLIGLYLAEGCYKTRAVQFSLHLDETNKEAFLRRWAESVGISVHAYRDGTKQTRQVLLFSTALGNWLSEEFGHGAHNKRLPSWFMHLPVNKQWSVWRAYYLGDGVQAVDDRSALRVTTRSEELARQWQMILLRLGYGATLHVTTDKGEPRFDLGISGSYGVEMASALQVSLPAKKRRFNHIKVDDMFGYYPVKEVTRLATEATVYNLEVDGRHSYCVPVIAHNCWIEKDALVGVIESACQRLDVDFFSCRGYTSLSEMWRAGERLGGYIDDGQEPIILHLGDHDPSGIDMTRDIAERLEMFVGIPVEVIRIALNRDQVDQYGPPPNPAKVTDSRAGAYIAEHGRQSWELDALEPTVLQQLIEDHVEEWRDEDLWEEAVAREKADKERLRKAAERMQLDED